MSVELQNAAQDLEKAIRQCEEYSLLEQAYKEVNADQSTKDLFENFRTIQMQLQQKQMMGQDISEEEVIQAQKSLALVQQNDKIVKLMEAEQQMSMSIAEMNQIIMKPLEELYGSMQ